MCNWVSSMNWRNRDSNELYFVSFSTSPFLYLSLPLLCCILPPLLLCIFYFNTRKQLSPSPCMSLVMVSINVNALKCFLSITILYAIIVYTIHKIHEFAVFASVVVKFNFHHCDESNQMCFANFIFGCYHMKTYLW